MSIPLEKGVQLHIINTQKYKTVRVYVRFTSLLEQTTITKRALLSNLLETNSLSYPDQSQLSEALAALYGASFGFNVGKKGRFHWVNAGINVVNGKYVEDETVLPAVFDFLHEVLFQPNIQAGAFDQETFDVEKENLKSYLNSLSEDKQTYASLALQELYFQDAGQRIPSVGAVADLEALTPQDLASYYRHMLTEDQIDIFVIGDVDQQQVETLVKEKLPFASREVTRPDIYYYQAGNNVVKERQEQEQVSQSKLNIAYQTGVYYGDPQRFSLLVFNGLFGGFPHSKLFMNVREKASLAYYASSNIDTFRGYLSVQTGIDGKNRNQVLHLVSEQLESLRQGEITEVELAQTKAMLKNQFLLSLDNPQALIETAYIDSCLPSSQLTTEEWLAHLEAVTIDDVKKVAAEVTLAGIFFLDGVANNG